VTVRQNIPVLTLLISAGVLLSAVPESIAVLNMTNCSPGDVPALPSLGQ
jgi:hypothetical protein